MMLLGRAPALLALAVATLSSCPAPPPAARSDVPEAVRLHLEAALAAPPDSLVLGEPLREREALLRFYTARDRRPAWLDRRNAVSELVEGVRDAERDGLDPERYHARALRTELVGRRAERDARRIAELDILLSDAFLHLAEHLTHGAVDPERLHPGYSRRVEPFDGPAALDEALRAEAVGSTLAGLAPHHAEYQALREALAHLRAVAAAGGWPPVPQGAPIKPGDCTPRVLALRSRLAFPSVARAARDPACLDPELARDLEDFQKHNGLETDGTLGALSAAALDVTATERADQVRANLERWRWLPDPLGRRHVRVNVAGFRLQAFDAGTSALDMRVVVGCPAWKTPLVHGEITHVVLNPAWYVPRSIAVREMLPLARRQPGYFASQGIEVLESAGGGAAAVDPARVDWNAVSAATFPYRLRQPPGTGNPLGRIKFVFENPFGIYLHGTPGRAALAAPGRALSHGCVRVEDEIALAGFAFASDPEWSEARIREALLTARERPLALPEPLPIDVVYLTASSDAGGVATFMQDPYGWDPPLLRLLHGSEREGAEPCDDDAIPQEPSPCSVSIER